MAGIRFVAVVAVGLSVACATTGRGRNFDTREPSSSARLITRQEILERGQGVATAYQAIQRLRANWLRPSGATSLRGLAPVLVYIDNVSRGEISVLESYPIEQVYEMRFYTALEATSRWGTGNSVGAIEVISGVLEARARVTEGSESGTGPTVTFEPYVPFDPKPLFLVGGGMAKLSNPLEIAEVWEPTAAFTAGIGYNATRNVTLFGTFEYNYFDFSESGTINYLQGHPRTPLRSTDGVELEGSASSIVNLSGNIKFHPAGGRVRPYLVGGIGYARFTAGAFRVSGPGGAPLPREQFRPGVAEGGDQSENSVTIASGVGFDVAIGSHLSVFTDARYVIGFRGPRYSDAFGRNQLQNTQFFPVRIGLTYR